MNGARARVAILCLALALPAWPSIAAAPDFDALPAPEQSLLAPARTLWPALDADARRQLLAQARHWQSLTPAGRDRLRRDLRAWDALPADERARRRGPFAAWQALSVDEREQVRAAARRYAAATPEQQARWRAEFAALPPDRQRDWWLGPSLGQDIAGLAPLFAFVPEAQKPDLLAMLRGLSPVARGQLQLVLSRLDDAGRGRLRQALLEAAPEQRAALIAQALQ